MLIGVLESERLCFESGRRVERIKGNRLGIAKPCGKTRVAIGAEHSRSSSFGFIGNRTEHKLVGRREKGFCFYNSLRIFRAYFRTKFRQDFRARFTTNCGELARSSAGG